MGVGSRASGSVRHQFEDRFPHGIRHDVYASRGGRRPGRRPAGHGNPGLHGQPVLEQPGHLQPGILLGCGRAVVHPGAFFSPTLNTGFTTSVASGGSVTYGDPQIGGHPPRYQNWSAGLQRAVTNTFTLTVSYVGSNGHYLGGGSRGIWGSQILPKYMALGNLLTSKASATTIAQADAIIPGIQLPYANFAGSIAQMLLPFPQYSSVSDAFGEVGDSNYNSLQVVAVKTLSHGLVLNANYSFAKAFDNLSSRSSYWAEKAQTTAAPRSRTSCWSTACRSVRARGSPTATALSAKADDDRLRRPRVLSRAVAVVPSVEGGLLWPSNPDKSTPIASYQMAT